jgi:hypothetical protein
MLCGLLGGVQVGAPVGANGSLSQHINSAPTCLASGVRCSVVARNSRAGCTTQLAEQKRNNVRTEALPRLSRAGGSAMGPISVAKAPEVAAGSEGVVCGSTLVGQPGAAAGIAGQTAVGVLPAGPQPGCRWSGGAGWCCNTGTGFTRCPSG